MSGNMRERVGRRTIVVMLFRNCNILIIFGDRCSIQSQLG